MAKLHAMKSMELDDEDKVDACRPIPCDTPDYPYGLRISLTHKELQKLNLDHKEAVIGGIIHGHFIARVTSVNQNQVNGEDEVRVEAQIEDLAIESEDDEGE